MVIDDLEFQRTPLETHGAGMLSHGHGRKDRVHLRELIPMLGQLDLRGAPGSEAFRAAARRVLGFDPPTEPNTVAGNGTVSALWLSPEEWLLVSLFDQHRRLANELEAALTGLHSAVVDVSASRTVLDLNGPAAREVLEKGCPLDLHPRAFGPGRCAQTLLARAPIILHQTDGTPTYRLFVRASYARYLASWLMDAMAEFL